MAALVHVPPPPLPVVLDVWNGIDASQFSLPFDEIGGGGAVLSVEQRSWGPVLRLTFPAKVTGNLLTFLTWANPQIPKANDLYRYTARCRMVGFSGVPGEWYSLGPAFLCNRTPGAGFYGLASMGSANTAGRAARVEAGVRALSAGTPGWFSTGLTAGLGGHNLNLRNAVFAKHVAGNAPGFRNTSYARKPTDTSVALADSYSDSYFIGQFGAFGAGWGAETLDTCGIAFLGNAGVTAGQWFEFDSFEILRRVEF